MRLAEIFLYGASAEARKERSDGIAITNRRFNRVTVRAYAKLKLTFCVNNTLLMVRPPRLELGTGASEAPVLSN